MTRFLQQRTTELAVVIFVAITVVRFLRDGVAEPIALFYVIPISLMAVRRGAHAGLATALAALTVFVVWDQVTGQDATVFDYIARAIAFLILGGVAGVLADQRGRAIRRSQRLFEMSNDMVCEANFDGYFTWLNPAWTETLGWSTDELMARPFLDFVHVEDREPTIDIAGALAEASTEIVEFENRYRTKDGSWRWLLWSARSDHERIYAIAKDVTQRKEREEQVEHQLETSEAMARTDALTGLPNRRAWDEELHRELARAKRLGLPVAIALLDLDHFKRFNDAHGHQAGDELLRECAHAWRITLRATDFIARYGGEEFGVLLPACPVEPAVRIVERLRAATAGDQTCSAGIAAWDGLESAEQLVRRADQALYEAKRSGRARTVVSETVRLRRPAPVVPRPAGAPDV